MDKALRDRRERECRDHAEAHSDAALAEVVLEIAADQPTIDLAAYLNEAAARLARRKRHQELIDDAYITLVRYRKKIGGALPMELQNLTAILVDHITKEAGEKAMKLW